MARLGHRLSPASTQALNITEVHKSPVMKLNRPEKDVEQDLCP